jgi:RNA polymerase sigma-70 factor
MAEVGRDFLTKYAGSLSDLARRGGAERWALPAEALAEAVYASVTAWASENLSTTTEHEIRAYLETLNAQDLVLACACRIGISSAWDEFVERYRHKLYTAARVLIHDEAKAREVADSLYGELYGLEQRRGVRRSLLSYFHGRSSLQTWLRAVVAQRLADSHRSERRMELRADIALNELVVETAEPPDPHRTSYINALSQTLASALEALRPRDRMRLNFYYLESLTLKQIGYVMKEHESTVSRRLARTRAQLRRQVDRALRREMHYSEDQIRLCYHYATEAGLPELSQIFPETDEP